MLISWGNSQFKNNQGVHNYNFFTTVWFVHFYYCNILYITKFHRLSDFRKKHDKHVLSHSLLVIMTYVICRLPSCIILIITVTQKNYPLLLLTWYAILVNPINSLVNPVIFWIVPFIKELWKKIKTSLH